LSCEGIDRFVLWSFDHFDQICSFISLWRAVSVRLSLSVSPSIPNSRLSDRNFSPSIPKSPPPSRTFSPSGDGSLDGIISHLTREHGGNVHDRGIVDISSKSRWSSCVPKHAADLQTQTYFHSLAEPDQWLCYDFKDRRVKPTHYSIHAHSGNAYLRSWIFEGSNDGSSWTILDEQKNNSTTNSSHPIGTFSVSRSAECRFIRLRQTGKNARGSDHLILFAFEIFGQLIE
jgi:hypothetical protein